MENETEHLDLTKVVLFTFLGALVVRGVYFLEHSGTAAFAVPMLDQLYYHLFAQEIVEGGDLRQFGGFRPVLYPLFVSFFYWIGGSAGTVLTIMAQHVLGAMTAAMAAVLSWFLSGGRVLAAISAGILCAIAGPLVFYEGELLIATFMAFLATLQLLLIAVALNSDGKAAVLWWVLAGLVGALAAQARPNMLLFFPAYLLIAGWFLWRERSRRPLVILSAVATIVVVQVGFGFVNKWQSGEYQLVTSAGGINFYMGNNQEADGMVPRMAYPMTYTGEYRDSIARYAEVEYERAMNEQGKTPSSDPEEISSYWYGRTWDEIGDAPGRWIFLMLKKTALVLSNYEIWNGESFAFSLQEESLLLWFLPGRWALVLFLFPAGVWMVWKGGDRRLLAFVLFFLGLYALSFILFFVNARFRIPLWPAAIGVSGCGAEFLVRRFREKRLADINGPLIAGAIAGGLSLFIGLLVPRESFSRPYFFRSIANYEIGRYEAARRDIQKSVEIESPIPDVLLQMGNVEFAMENYGRALEHYRNAAEEEPYEPRVFNNIGATHEEMGRYQEAYEAYLHALELSPQHQTALVNAGLLELRAGWLEQAEAHIEAAREAPSQGNEITVRIARALLSSALGDSETAQLMLDEAAGVNRQLVERMVAEYREKIELQEPEETEED